MNRLNMQKLVWFVFVLLVVGACKKDEISYTALKTNEWIKENMELYYLWNNKLPNIDETKEPDPAAYFEKLLYSSLDKWSWITDDYASLEAEYAGTPVTYGVDASPTWTSSSQTEVCFIVNFVYPGSAAETAGLKRGDIILKLNGAAITGDNYMTFYNSTSMTIQLASIVNGALVLNGTSYSLTAKTTTTDPSIYHNVLDVDGKKIGYLVYVEFVAGSNDMFLTSLDNIFSEFKTEGVTDLILDLRYNPGGEIDAAAYLASAIAPNSVVTQHKALVNMKYNTELQAFLESDSKYADNLTYKFVDNATNLNLSRLYCLTTGGSASASELLMIGLAPYMDVYRIGETTYGKYTGMWVLPDDNEEWCMLPVVLKYSNIDGLTDFANGLTPDYAVEDYLTLGYEFGNTEDPMLAKAISLITGTVTSTASAKSARVNLLEPANLTNPRDIKRNLFVPAPTGIE